MRTEQHRSTLSGSRQTQATRSPPPATCPAGRVDQRRELRRLDDRAPPPRRHAGQVRISGHDQERAHRRGQVKDPVVLPVRAVTDGLRRVGDPSQSGQSPTVCGGSAIPPPDASAISASTRRYSSVSSSGVLSTVATTRPVLTRMCGESHSANSAASLTTPRQSALGFPDTGGGDGQLRNGDPPAATASTSTFTSNTTGTGTGPGRFNAPAARPY